MGTNYFGKLKEPKKRVVFDFEEFHIGKSSCGWQFTFQKSEHFGNFEEFKKWLEDDRFEVVDEYNRTIDKKEFLEMIIKKQNEKEHQSNYDSYTKLIDGFNFSENDFS